MKKSNQIYFLTRNIQFRQVSCFRWLVFFSILLLFFSCENIPTERKTIPAFYHWQTNFNLSPTEQQYVDNFPIQKIYVKFFDVDWDVSVGEPLPLAEVNWETIPPEYVTIVPTVFITNRSLKTFALEKMEYLGDHILEKINELLPPVLQESQRITEIQIDCDWTELTQDKYFRLLRRLKKKLSHKKIQLSATIRLHQVKFFKRTGVPPVDQGMLMFYNVDEVQDISTQNSILDVEVAQQYLVNFEKYPLTLGIALPIFSWGVLFRNDKMIKLMTHLRVVDLADTTFFSPLSPSHFEVKKSTYLDGQFLYEDDVIRLEEVSLEQLSKTAQLLTSQISNDELTVSFYHLDTSTIKYYPYEDLQKVVDFFHKK